MFICNESKVQKQEIRSREQLKPKLGTLINKAENMKPCRERRAERCEDQTHRRSDDKQRQTHYKYTQGNEGVTHRRGAQLNKAKQEMHRLFYKHNLRDTNRTPERTQVGTTETLKTQTLRTNSKQKKLENNKNKLKTLRQQPRTTV